MTMNEFVQDLPSETKCDCCSRKIVGLDWGVGPFGKQEWMGICIVRCSSCAWCKIAAAGSSNEAHHRAQMMRLELIVKMEGRGWSRAA